MAFKNVGKWFDQLPPKARAGIVDERRKVGTPGRLLPGSHGTGIKKNLEVARLTFQRAREPFSLIRIGDTELALLSAGYFPGGSNKSIDFKLFRCGLDRAAFPLRGEFIAACKHAKLLGLHQNWAPVRTNTAVILRMLGFRMPNPRAVEVHLPYELLVRGDLLRFTANKRVLLVGTLAPRLDQAWRNIKFQQAHEQFGPMGAIKSLRAVHTGARGTRSYLNLQKYMVEILKERFDVALLGAGAVAKILANRIRRAGMTALDVGYVFDALLGVTPAERAARPVFRDVKWPRGKF